MKRTGPDRAAHSVAFSRDRKRIFAAGSIEDPALYSWNADQAEGRRLTFPWGMRSYVVFSPDASEVAMLGTNWAFRIYDLKDGDQLMKSATRRERLPEAPEYPVWSRDGRFIVCSSSNTPTPGQSPHLHRGRGRRKVVQTLEGHKSPLRRWPSPTTAALSSPVRPTATACGKRRPIGKPDAPVTEEWPIQPG